MTAIRAAEATDLGAMADLHTRARTAYYTAGGYTGHSLYSEEGLAERRNGWAQIIASERHDALCAVDGAVLVGVLALGPPHGDVDPDAYRELYQIHVEPGRWRQGIGRALHGEFVRRVRNAGYSGAVVEAWEGNARGRAFYAKLGWLPDGARRPGPNDVDYVRMRLVLGGRTP